MVNFVEYNFCYTFVLFGTGSSLLTPILGAMLGDGPIRMITTGHELTFEDDDKTLGEMQFKDMQVSGYFISLAAFQEYVKVLP